MSCQYFDVVQTSCAYKELLEINHVKLVILTVSPNITKRKNLEVDTRTSDLKGLENSDNFLCFFNPLNKKGNQ